MATLPKTIRLLLSLDKNARQRFRLFLKSPFFNTNETLLDTYEKIISTYKDLDSEYTKDEILNACEYKSENTYDKHLNRLGNLFEKFIVAQTFEGMEDGKAKDKNENQKKSIAKENNGNKDLQNLLILQDYLYRIGGEFFNEKFTDAKKKLSKSVIGLNKYYYQYKLEEIYDTYVKTYEDKRKGDANIQAASNALERDFVVNKLFYLISMHNRHNITKHIFDYGFEKVVEQYYLKQEVLDDSFINILYQAYKVLTDSEISVALENLKKQLRVEDQNIARDLIFSLSMVVHNKLKYVIKDKKVLDKEHFELYEILLEQKYAEIEENGKIPSNFYKNFALNCLELGKYDFAEKLIEDYKEKLLPIEKSENIHCYCKALLYVYQNEVNEAQRLLLKIDSNFKDSLLKFGLRFLEIMIHYDLKNYEFLDTQIQNLSIALIPERTKSISEENKVVYKNFQICIKKMCQCITNPNSSKKDANEISHLINKTNKLPNRNWFLMRVDDLKRKYSKNI